MRSALALCRRVDAIEAKLGWLALDRLNAALVPEMIALPDEMVRAIFEHLSAMCYAPPHDDAATALLLGLRQVAPALAERVARRAGIDVLAPAETAPAAPGAPCGSIV